MSFHNPDVTGSSLHIVDGSDPLLIRLHQELVASHSNVLLVEPTESLNTVVHDLQQIRPKGGFDSVHLYGHGAPGAQLLGTDVITGESVGEDRQSWRSLGQLAGPNADLLLYGCRVGAGRRGSNLLDQLSAATGLDSAASTDTTTQEDWELEHVHGVLETTPTGPVNWSGELKMVSPSWMNVLSQGKEKALVDAIAGQRGQDLRQAKFMGYHLTNQSNQDGTTNDVIEALQDFWDRVAERTNGKLNMTVLASDANVEGSDNEALLGVANGRFDAVTANGPIFSGIIPEVANIMTLLFAYNDSAEGRALVNDPVFQAALLDAGEPYNWRFLTRATLNSGMRDIATIPGHPIVNVGNLSGFKLRIPPSDSIQAQLESLDVIPVLTPISELQEALETGQAYGEENPPSFIQTFNLNGICNELSITNHLWTGFLTAINLETWKSWPKQWRQIVLSEQKAMQNQQWTAQDLLNQQIIQEAPSTYGMTVVHPDLAAVNDNADFVSTRSQTIKSLTPALRPLARAIVQGYRVPQA